jgi:hypothetical protein
MYLNAENSVFCTHTHTVRPVHPLITPLFLALISPTYNYIELTSLSRTQIDSGV